MTHRLRRHVPSPQSPIPNPQSPIPNPQSPIRAPARPWLAARAHQCTRAIAAQAVHWCPEGKGAEAPPPRIRTAATVAYIP
ncbi:hypothetical protein E1J23_18920 [Xanthomonas gardneri]|nr:hypothetical protein [Xanthomonas hortorum pv. gardneri]